MYDYESIEWTDGTIETPDVDSVIQPLGEGIIVRPVIANTKTKGGILIPDMVQDNINNRNVICEVVSIGPLAWIDTLTGEEVAEEERFNIGDFVLMPNHCGHPVEIKGVKLKLCQAKHPLAIIKDISAIKVKF